MGLFGKKYQPPYPTGYELGFNGTAEELKKHAEVTGGVGRYISGGDSPEEEWHKKTTPDVVRGAIAALKEGRPQNLGTLINASRYKGDADDAVKGLTAEEVKSMNLTQNSLISLAWHAICSGDTKEIGKLLDAGMDIHYGHEYLLREASRMGDRDSVVEFLYQRGASFDEACYGVDVRDKDPAPGKARLRAYQARLTGKEAPPQDAAAQIAEMKKEMCEMSKKLESVTAELNTLKANNNPKPPGM